MCDCNVFTFFLSFKSDEPLISASALHLCKYSISFLLLRNLTVCIFTLKEESEWGCTENYICDTTFFFVTA